MMIGTVMMSQSSNQQQQSGGGPGTETANMKQINSISQMVSNNASSQQEYISDTEMSERTVGSRSNHRNQYSRNTNANKNGQYVLNGTNLSYDQQSISSQSTAKMIQSRLNNPSVTMMSMNGGGRQQNNNNNTNVSSMTLTSRKMSERSVNFDEENYSKLKPSQQNEQPPPPSQSTKQTKKQQRGDTNHYGNGSVSHYGNGGMTQDEDKQQIQVQILPQDDNWGENTTAFTADFSDFNDDMTEDGRSSHFNGRMGSGRKEKGKNPKLEYYCLCVCF